MRCRNFPVRSAALAPLLVVALTGCYDEGLGIHDLEGTLVLPREAAIQTITVPVDEDGNPVTDPGETTGLYEERVVGPDVRMLGPVYVGLYADVVYDFQNFPHPEVGPGVNDYDEDGEQDADAFPYGGTTVGDFRYACFEYFRCKMVSGRYTDFDDILDFFNEELLAPVTDVRGQIVGTGDTIRATCYELLNVTADSEVRITATEDRNDDGAIDAGDLDFVETPEGDFVADFKIYQADYFDGMSAWAWMDAPKGRSYQFSSCNPEIGYTEDNYDQRWFAGTARSYVLNAPHLLLQDEDWVASRGAVWETPWTQPELRLDFNIGSSDIEPLRAEAAAAAKEGE